MMGAGDTGIEATLGAAVSVGAREIEGHRVGWAAVGEAAAGARDTDGADVVTVSLGATVTGGTEESVGSVVFRAAVGTAVA